MPDTIHVGMWTFSHSNNSPFCHTAEETVPCLGRAQRIAYFTYRIRPCTSWIMRIGSIHMLRWTWGCGGEGLARIPLWRQASFPSIQVVLRVEMLRQAPPLPNMHYSVVGRIKSRRVQIYTCCRAWIPNARRFHKSRTCMVRGGACCHAPPPYSTCTVPPSCSHCHPPFAFIHLH